MAVNIVMSFALDGHNDSEDIHYDSTMIAHKRISVNNLNSTYRT
jgi:hypothetical protein